MEMLTAPYIEEVRLTRFKSFVDAVLPLRDLTLLIGRNGSGKSNAIDGLQVLTKLALNDDIRDAIEGSRCEGPDVRGGARGCAPFGERTFELGCRVRAGDDVVGLDLAIQVEPDMQIVRERLWCDEESGERPLLETDPPDEDRTDIVAHYDNGKRGPNPGLLFRSSRLLTTQVATKVPSDSRALERVHRAAAQVIEALEAVFVLDPVPHLMRQYVPARDSILRRQADNLSAAVGAVLEQPETKKELHELVRSLTEQPVDGISVQPSSLGDVIIALEERQGRRCVPVSARVMSDGMLRFVAFATALLSAQLDTSAGKVEAGQTMLVIEEIENGLHPSQAARVLQLVKAQAQRGRVRTLATTHSPAILTALDAPDHPSVIVCDRDPGTGVSRLRPLVELPSYARAMAVGSLGDAVTRGRLTDNEQGKDSLGALDAILAEL